MLLSFLRRWLYIIGESVNEGEGARKGGGGDVLDRGRGSGHGQYSLWDPREMLDGRWVPIVAISFSASPVSREK